MIFNVKILADVNLAIQMLLLLTVAVAYYLARKGQLIRHCNIMRIAVAVQLLAIFTVMLPAMLGYVKHPRPVALQTEMLIHHSLGALVIFLWVYINLAFTGKVRLFGRLATFMKIALVIWVLTFLLGLYLYFQVFVL